MKDGKRYIWSWFILSPPNSSHDAFTIERINQNSVRVFTRPILSLPYRASALIGWSCNYDSASDSCSVLSICAPSSRSSRSSLLILRNLWLRSIEILTAGCIPLNPNLRSLMALMAVLNLNDPSASCVHAEHIVHQFRVIALTWVVQFTGVNTSSFAYPWQNAFIGHFQIVLHSVGILIRWWTSQICLII